MSIKLFDQVKKKQKGLDSKGSIVLIAQGSDFITFRQDAEILSEVFGFHTEISDQVLFCTFHLSYLDMVVDTCTKRLNKKIYLTKSQFPTMNPEFIKENFESVGM